MIYRELTRAELDGLKIPDIDFRGKVCRVAGALDSGEVVAVWALVPVVHAEPLWIAEKYRKSPTIIRRLLGVLSGIVKSDSLLSSQDAVVACIPQGGAVEHIARWLGGTRLGGVYTLPTVDLMSFPVKKEG